MAKRVQLVRHVPSEAEQFIGLDGEVTVETENYALRVHDGVTEGGFRTLTQDIADGLYVSETDFTATVDQIEQDIQDAVGIADDDLLQKFLIQRAPVKDRVTALPGGPAVGDRYLIANAGTVGIAVGHENEVAEYTAAGWIYSGAPKDGARTFNNATQTVFVYELGVNNWTTTDEALETTYITPLNMALALKAPLASPALTGTPTSITPDLGDSSNKIATTEYVKALLAGTLVGGLIVVDGASAAAVAADHGKTFLFKNTGIGIHSLTLPAVADVGPGWAIHVKISAIDGDHIAITTVGGNTIDGLASRIGGGNTNVVVMCDGVSFFTHSGEYVLKSAYGALAYSALNSFVHNFGIIPDRAQVNLKCIAAEANYSIGDVITFTSISPDNNQGQGNLIHDANGNTTSWLVTVDISIGDKTAHTNFGALTVAKWNLQIVVVAK